MRGIRAAVLLCVWQDSEAWPNQRLPVTYASRMERVFVRCKSERLGSFPRGHWSPMSHQRDMDDMEQLISKDFLKKFEWERSENNIWKQRQIFLRNEQNGNKKLRTVFGIQNQAFRGVIVSQCGDFEMKEPKNMIIRFEEIFIDMWNANLAF
jgi:hypothetical protein